MRTAPESSSRGRKPRLSSSESVSARAARQDGLLSAFSALGQRLSASQTAKEAAQIIASVADQLLGWDCCLLDLYSPEEDILTHVLNSDVIDGRRSEFPPQYSRMPPSPLARQAILEGGLLLLKEDPGNMWPEGRPFGDTSRPSASIMFVPIRDGATVAGVLSIQSYTPKAYDQQSLATLQVLADHGGGTLSRIRMAEALQHRLEVESRVSQISTRFVNLPRSETDAAIAHALEILGNSTGADHACALCYAPDVRGLAKTHQWHAEASGPCVCVPDGPLAKPNSWWGEELRRCEAICMPRLSALPLEAGAEKEVLERLGIKSFVAVPLRHGEAFLGYLRLSSMRHKRLWNQEHLSLLKIVSEILTNGFQHQRAAERIERLNRLYSVLTRINGLIVRTPPLEALCEQACRIVVDGGLFRMAWVAMVEPTTRAVKILAHCGLHEGAASSLQLSALRDAPRGQGPTGTAIREGHYELCHDAQQDPRMAPWRDALANHDYRSIAAFPLKVSGQVVGALTLCKAEPYAFDHEEIALLEELSGDLSFAIEVGGQAKQLQLQSTALESAANSIVITSSDGVISWVNPAFTRLYGLYGPGSDRKETEPSQVGPARPAVLSAALEHPRVRPGLAWRDHQPTQGWQSLYGGDDHHSGA